MEDDLKLLMIGAMYENGGNTTHRFLDGHPELFVYPFESQLGTRLIVDQLSSVFPVKYRWPVFALDATPEQNYRAIIDEECKVRSRTPNVSKFRDYEFDFSDDDRCARFLDQLDGGGSSRGAIVAAFFRATFDAWKSFRRSGDESVYVGYSPAITVDAELILGELPGAHFLHVVRNPWSAYADTKKRPVPLPLAGYLLGWTLNQYYALLAKERFPDRFHLIRFEDLVEDPGGVLGAVCERLGVSSAASLAEPSWNGQSMTSVYPWGTIRSATADANRATAAELSSEETEEVRRRAGPYLELLEYAGFPGSSVVSGR
jgi:hypothetical protein